MPDSGKRWRILSTPTLSPGSLPVFLKGAEIPAPFRGARVRFTHQARYALWHGLGALGLGPGASVAVPAYHCGTEIDPILERGAAVQFYDVDASLRVRPEALERVIDANTRAVLVTHFFGIPQEMDAVSRLCRDRHLYLIEDCAHTLGGGAVGTVGDIAIFSPRKLLPIPDGGALRVNSKDAPVPAAVELPALGGTMRCLRTKLLRNLALRLPGPGTTPAPVESPQREPGPGPAESFHAEHTGWGMSRFSLAVLGSADLDRIACTRRRYFRQLLAGLTAGPEFAPLVTELPEDTCPWVFPLRVADPAGLARHLRSLGIEVLGRFWDSFHPAFPRERFPEATQLKEHVLTLPVHQDLTPAAVDYVIAAVNSWREEEAHDRQPALPSVSRRTGPSVLDVVEVGTLEGLEAIQEAWAGLIDRTRSDNLFLTFEWMSSWWKTHGEGRRLLILVVRDEGEVVGIVPWWMGLQKYTGLRFIRFLGTGPSDRLDFLIRGDATAVLEHALQYLEERRIRWDFIDLQEIPGESPHRQPLQDVLSRRGEVLDVPLSQSPYLNIESDWETFFARRFPGKSRRRFRIRRKKLQESPCSIHHYTRLKAGAPLLERIAGLKQSKTYRGRTRYGLLAEPQRRAFLESLLPRFAARGWLRVATIELSDQLVCYILGFEYAGKYHEYFRGFDPEYSHLSPGRILLEETLERCFKQRLKSVEFLRGEESWKLEWTDKARENRRIVAFRRGARGWLARRLLTWKWDLRTATGTKATS